METTDSGTEMFVLVASITTKLTNHTRVPVTEGMSPGHLGSQGSEDRWSGWPLLRATLPGQWHQFSQRKGL